jgi:uncharacterized membrane protein (UPF0127 family)
MKRVRLAANGWSVEAMCALTFYERWRGLRGAPAHSRLLMESSSVHTFGMHTPISVVMIDSDLRVVRAQSLPPNRVVYDRRARFMLELPELSAVPPLGAPLEIADV